jgi:leucyl-tRNA synthetase
MQRNWIGRKVGVISRHNVNDLNMKIETFSAYPAWLFADTFLVIAPEHPIVDVLVKGTKYEKETNLFIEESKKISAQERTEDKFEKKGVFTGRYAEDPFNKGRLMPIWIANFALLDFGTGIIRCSAHDVRDYVFAQKYKIHLEEVVKRINRNEPVNAHDNSGILVNSGEFTGRSIDKKLIEDIKNWIVKTKIGRKETTYHLRDWIFSRQRYWGEPIPMVNCEKCGWQPLPEDQLPLKLPYVKSYEPTETGESPLSVISEFVNTTCPKCGGKAKRETDTMPNWAGSCWYFLRFADPKNEKQAWSPEAMKKWMPTDWYIGGAEHAVLHLLYARFWIKALYDLKLLNFKEPFTRLRNLGMILAEDHQKMSKSFGNVINPDDVIKEYGADALRIYEMFMAPFDAEIAWSTKSLQGSYRFVKRIWDLFQQYNNETMKSSFAKATEDKQLVAKLQKTIQKVTSDIPGIKFNTAIAMMMEFLNDYEKNPQGLSKENAKKFLQILAPFAPYMTEEIWRNIFKEKSSIHLSVWPTISGEIIEEEIVLPIQVNGKLRSTLRVSRQETSKDIEKKALEDDRIKKYIIGKPKKIIYVPGKIINFIT